MMNHLERKQPFAMDQKRRHAYKLFSGVILGFMVVFCLAVVPVGTEYPKVSFSTNGGTIFIGVSNAALSLVFTNNVVIGTGAVLRITSSGGFTNDAPSVLKGAVIATNVNIYALTTTYATMSAITNNDFSAANIGFINITNQSGGGIVFTGFAGGVPGQRLLVLNTTATNLTFEHLSGSSSVSNRIDLTGIHTATTNTVGMGSFELIWSPTSNRWSVISFQP